MRYPAGVLPELFTLLRADANENKPFAMSTLSGMFANEVDDDIRGWLETLIDDEDKAVQKLALLALAPGSERRFRGIDIREMGRY
jgi:hypothetical protein